MGSRSKHVPPDTEQQEACRSMLDLLELKVHQCRDKDLLQLKQK